MIVIVDYGCGNPVSIRNMLKKIGYPSQISSDPSVVSNADKLILPGVGSFDRGMLKLKEFGLLDALAEKVLQEKTPILGICLGVQLFCKKSEEGREFGLGWIDADVVHFDRKKMCEIDKTPHMGWTDTVISYENKLIVSKEELPRYYYVHSYHLVCRNRKQVLATAVHGYEFAVAIEQDNIVGVQFHPEKSHRFGMNLLKNFVEKY